MAALDDPSVDALRQRVRTSPYASCYCEENVYRLVDDWAMALSEDERAKLFGGNAARFYRLR